MSARGSDLAGGGVPWAPRRGAGGVLTRPRARRRRNMQDLRGGGPNVIGPNAATDRGNRPLAQPADPWSLRPRLACGCGPAWYSPLRSAGPPAGRTEDLSCPCSSGRPSPSAPSSPPTPGSCSARSHDPRRPSSRRPPQHCCSTAGPASAPRPPGPPPATPCASQKGAAPGPPNPPSAEPSSWTAPTGRPWRGRQPRSAATGSAR
jgi:hypothetical protein